MAESGANGNDEPPQPLPRLFGISLPRPLVGGLGQRRFHSKTLRIWSLLLAPRRASRQPPLRSEDHSGDRRCGTWQAAIGPKPSRSSLKGLSPRVAETLAFGHSRPDQRGASTITT